MGYKPDYVLGMPARRFFSMRTALFDIERREKGNEYHELCAISAITGVNSIEYYRELQQYYRKMGMSKDQLIKYNNPRVINADDPEQGKMAANVLQGYFGLAAR
jgi:hypothetical protein